jgi:hypothetical protein
MTCLWWLDCRDRGYLSGSLVMINRRHSSRRTASLEFGRIGDGIEAAGCGQRGVSSAELQGDAEETTAAESVSSGTAVRLSRALSLKPGLHRSSRSDMEAGSRSSRAYRSMHCCPARYRTRLLSSFGGIFILVRPPHLDRMFPSLLSHCKDRFPGINADHMHTNSGFGLAVTLVE